MTPMLLPARYLDAAGVERECVVRCASLDEVIVETDAGPAAGDRIVCRIDLLGTLSGTVAGPEIDGFRLLPDAGTERRRRLASRIGWLLRRSAAGNVEQREATRVVAQNRDVVVAWDGVQRCGLLRDLSTSGAAVDLVPRPSVGMPVTVGARRATVARHTDDGFAVRFVLPLNPADVHEDAIL